MLQKVEKTYREYAVRVRVRLACGHLMSKPFLPSKGVEKEYFCWTCANNKSGKRRAN